jgi:hypothetical protein
LHLLCAKTGIAVEAIVAVSAVSIANDSTTNVIMFFVYKICYP